MEESVDFIPNARTGPGSGFERGFSGAQRRGRTATPPGSPNMRQIYCNPQKILLEKIIIVKFLMFLYSIADDAAILQKKLVFRKERLKYSYVINVWAEIAIRILKDHDRE